MPDKPPRRYGLDAERFAQVDAELVRAEAYFTRLRDEMRDKAADTAKNEYNVRTAEMVIEAIKRLRFELAQEQERKDQGREIQQRLYGRGDT